MSSKQNELTAQLHVVWTEGIRLAKTVCQACELLVSPSMDAETRSVSATSLATATAQLMELKASFEVVRSAWKQADGELTEDLVKLQAAWTREIASAAQAVGQTTAQLQASQKTLVHELATVNRTHDMLNAYGRE